MAPCAAVLGVTGELKCYNTRSSCQDSANYTPGTLTLQFGREDQLDLLRYYGNVLPMLMGSPSTTPARINLAAMDRSASALGQREVVTLQMKDGLHSDNLVDKYRLERATGEAMASGTDGYDPYSRGTFWGKFLARNPYHSGYPLRVYQGYLGDALADMRVRHYIVDRIEGPSDGAVKIVAKDIFSKIEARKSVAPVASLGELAANITSSATSATLSPAGIGNLDYPASGHVAIGDEIMAFTRSADTLTLTRGQLNTTAEAHEDEDLVQLVLSYEADLGHDIVYDLLVNYSEIDPALIDKTEWDTLAVSITDLFTGRISTPTPVNDLIGELCEQAGFTIWPDVSDGTIKFRALRAGAVSPTVDDDAWIVDGSLGVRRQDAKRVSQVWVYYGQIDPTANITERKNFRSRLVVVDTDAEDSTQYGVPAIREVFSRWIPQFGRQAAERCGDRIIAMFRDAPLEVSFAVHVSRDGELDLAQYFSLETADVQDDTGAVKATAMATVEMSRGENEIGVKAQAVTFADVSGAGGTDEGREIFIENSANNLNIRTIHDSLFATPTGVEEVTVYVLASVVVGSTSTSSPALRTGTWPSGQPLTLVNDGLISGKGGLGGNGGGMGAGTAGAPGSAGGPALQADVPLSVNNTTGIIAGGAGGGGGGSSSVPVGGGSGGGGGAGTQPGVGGSGGTNATNGSSGTALVGGDGGTGLADGGDGGNPGQAGGSGDNSTDSGGAGGAPGSYILGNANVTWLALGDVRGGVS